MLFCKDDQLTIWLDHRSAGALPPADTHLLTGSKNTRKNIVFREHAQPILERFLKGYEAMKAQQV
jgi:hypothetical protein